MRRLALVWCCLWLVGGAGCASQPTAPGATKPWYQLGSWKKAQPESAEQLRVTEIQDMTRGPQASAQYTAPGQYGPAQYGPGAPGMASASSGQQY